MKPSRRSFLLSAASAPLAAHFNLGGKACLTAAAPLPGEQMRFENPQLIRYDAKCFTVREHDTLVMSGAFHYPRCPQALWRDRLQKFKLAGFNTIETYVFWNYHEPREGKADLASFEDFVKLVEEMGFLMIARPGPYICAEWDRGGFPSWVAAKRFPLRSANPESLRTSQHWYGEVLPVIQRHQVTVGGPIMMVQIENEYDLWKPVPDAEKREYIRALAQMASSAGINVPLITCWTRQVRERTDPDMAKIMDTCNFYTRWKIQEEVPPALEKLRREEPASPVMVTELQGGWFSEFGGLLSDQQEGLNAAQINMLTDTALEMGVTSFNYYMGFGGTNFDWAAKKLTTTYDYAAPIREPGGLWDKYDAVRGIGQSLRVFGDVLTRAVVLPGAQCTNPQVSVTERTNGPSGVLFVRENANAPQRFKMTFTDTHSPSKRVISAPRQGELELAPREMKMLPVQITISGGGRLCYSTGEILTHGLNLERDFVILYDRPGRFLEMGFATINDKEPEIEGETAYRFWDPEYETSVLGLQVGTSEKMFLYYEHLQVFVLPREKALRTFFWEFPPKIVPGAEETKTVVAPIFSDVYFLAGSGTFKNWAWVDLDFLPGPHDVAMMIPPLPEKCRIDGNPAGFRYDRDWNMAHLQVTTPALPAQPISLNAGEAWVEKFDPASGEWVTSPPHALEDMGEVPYGYVKYRTPFTFDGEPKMFISTHTDDAKKVFVNGKFVAEASNTETLVDFPLAKYAQPGANLVEISYEAFGAPNFGENVGELKGLESAGIGAELASAKGLDSWQIQRTSALMRGRELIVETGPTPTEGSGHPTARRQESRGVSQTSAAGSGHTTAETGLPPASVTWASASFLSGGANSAPVPAFTWGRARFTLPAVEDAWKITWKLTFDADCDALIFLNGKFVGRYVTIGPQHDFYLPEPYLAPAGENTLTFVLAYTDQAQHLRKLQVAPYAEYSARRTRIEFEWYG